MKHKNPKKKSGRISAAKVRLILLDYIIMTAGAAIYALSVIFFTAPNNIAPGGVTGISTMLNYLFELPIGAMTLVLNIPLLIWGAFENGSKFILRTFYATALSSILIDVFTFIPFRYTGEMILAAIFGGLVSGVGLGLIFLRGGSTGGTDIVGRNLHNRLPHLSVGRIILFCDIIVIVISAVVYNNIENALYAVVAIFTSSKVIDAVVFGFSRDNGKLLIIISDKPDDVRSSLVQADRGVTLIDAKGGYTDAPKGVILCAVHPRDVYRVKNCITVADPDAFVITTTATAISGQGFESLPLGGKAARRLRGAEQ